jgi:hypothetical protein
MAVVVVESVPSYLSRVAFSSGWITIYEKQPNQFPIIFQQNNKSMTAVARHEEGAYTRYEEEEQDTCAPFDNNLELSISFTPPTIHGSKTREHRQNLCHRTLLYSSSFDHINIMTYFRPMYCLCKTLT